MIHYTDNVHQLWFIKFIQNEHYVEVKHIDKQLWNCWDTLHKKWISI